MKSNLLHVHQVIEYRDVTPERLYNIYMSAEEHARATGQPTHIDPREGGLFSAYDGLLTGRFVKLVPGKLIIQEWRSKLFTENAPDSLVLLAFRQNDCPATEIEFVQVNVPDGMTAHDASAWNHHYWEPMREYLRGPRG